MKVLAIARKTLIEAWRDRQLTAIFLLFPALMVLMYYLAYGGTTMSMANYITVLVYNQDRGALGTEFIQVMRSMTFDGQPALTVQELTDPFQAQTALAEGKAALLLTIPPDFSDAVSLRQSSPARVELLGDLLTDTFMFGRSFLTETARLFVNQKIGWQKPAPELLEFLPNTGKLSDFQVGIPGLMVFGVLFGVITSALLLVREESAGTLQRLRLSGARSQDVLLGITLANLALMLVQVPVCFVVALAFGMQAPGSLIMSVLIALVLGLGATGLGFIAACFSHNEGEATGYSTTLMVPMVFLTGAIFPMPVVNLFTVGGQAVQIYDILPSTHAVKAIQRILLYADSPASVAYHLVLLVILSGLLLVAGIKLYQRKIQTGQ